MKNFLRILLGLIVFGLIVVGVNSSPPQKMNDHVKIEKVYSPSEVSAPVMFAQDTTVTLPAPDNPNNIWNFVKNNVAELVVALMGFIKVIVNLTPTEKDNKIFGLLDTFINWIIPNYKVGGGTHVDPG